MYAPEAKTVFKVLLRVRSFIMEGAGQNFTQLLDRGGEGKNLTPPFERGGQLVTLH